MDFKPLKLPESFSKRDKELEKLKRYEDEEGREFLIMFYRTNDLIHSRRVLFHLEKAIPNILSVYGNRFRTDFARTLAWVHDDAEIETGDPLLYKVERMTEKERAELKEMEKIAIPEVIKKYGSKVNGFDYGELLTSAKDKDNLEAHFVSFFDKFDGAGEAWHEVWAGNRSFLRPSREYIERLGEFPTKYPDMKPFFEKFPGYLPKNFNFASVAEKGKPHTPQSLREFSGYLPYEDWKFSILEREGLDNLIRQTEFG
ncbi:MAG: YfbR-like 5'-deoxynucleotidase [Candidatus Pacearchaeota archaeon]